VCEVWAVRSVKYGCEIWTIFIEVGKFSGNSLRQQTRERERDRERERVSVNVRICNELFGEKQKQTECCCLLRYDAVWSGISAPMF